MLKKILSITGKPGLFKIISHSTKNLLVEDIESKKRFPCSARDKIVSLGDIAMYTIEDDKPLGEILDLVYTKKDGQPIDVKALVDSNALKEEFATILPNFDTERVHDKDIKKLFKWYNILLADGMTKFTEEEKPEEKPDEASVNNEDKVKDQK